MPKENFIEKHPLYIFNMSEREAKITITSTKEREDVFIEELKFKTKIIEYNSKLKNMDDIKKYLDEYCFYAKNNLVDKYRNKNYDYDMGYSPFPIQEIYIKRFNKGM